MVLYALHMTRSAEEGANPQIVKITLFMNMQFLSLIFVLIEYQTPINLFSFTQ